MPAAQEGLRGDEEFPTRDVSIPGIIAVVCSFRSSAPCSRPVSGASISLPFIRFSRSSAAIRPFKTGADQRIEGEQTEIKVLSAQLDVHKETQKKVEAWEPGRSHERDRMEHQLSGEVARLESRLDNAATRLWRLQQAKQHYVIRFLPADRFQTMACPDVVGCRRRGG